MVASILYVYCGLYGLCQQRQVNDGVSQTLLATATLLNQRQHQHQHHLI